MRQLFIYTKQSFFGQYCHLFRLGFSTIMEYQQVEAIKSHTVVTLTNFVTVCDIIILFSIFICSIQYKNMYVRLGHEGTSVTTHTNSVSLQRIFYCLTPFFL